MYVFGDHTPHLHFNLAPHCQGDGLRGGPGLLEPDVVDVGLGVHQTVAEAARLAMAPDQRLTGARSANLVGPARCLASVAPSARRVQSIECTTTSRR